MAGKNDVPVARSGIGCGSVKVVLAAPIEAALIVPFVAGAPVFVTVTVRDVPVALRVSTGFDALMTGPEAIVLKNPTEEYSEFVEP
jgi:hypothetical protein